MPLSWRVNHLVVLTIRASGQPKVYHHPDCFVLERAMYTVDQTLLEAEKHPGIRPCKVCEASQLAELACPTCYPLYPDQEPFLLVRVPDQAKPGSWLYQCQHCDLSVPVVRR